MADPRANIQHGGGGYNPQVQGNISTAAGGKFTMGFEAQGNSTVIIGERPGNQVNIGEANSGTRVRVHGHGCGVGSKTQYGSKTQ